MNNDIESNGAYGQEDANNGKSKSHSIWFWVFLPLTCILFIWWWPTTFIARKFAVGAMQQGGVIPTKSNFLFYFWVCFLIIFAIELVAGVFIVDTYYPGTIDYLLRLVSKS